MRLIGLAFVLMLSLIIAPLAAEAQQSGKLYRIGLLGGSPPTSPGGRRAWEGFFQGMQPEHPRRGPMVRGTNRPTPLPRGRACSAQSGRHSRGCPTRSRGGQTRHVDDPHRHGDS